MRKRSMRRSTTGSVELRLRFDHRPRVTSAVGRNAIARAQATGPLPVPVARGGGADAGWALALRLTGRLEVPVTRHSQWRRGCGVALAVPQWHAVALACQRQSRCHGPTPSPNPSHSLGPGPPGSSWQWAQLRAPPSARPGSDISRLRLAKAWRREGGQAAGLRDDHGTLSLATKGGYAGAAPCCGRLCSRQ